MDTAIHCLGWDKPFSIRFAELLKEAAGGSRELDGWLIWVPSSRAGRHILNELFTGAVEGTEAFHPPRMVTPAQFVRSLLAGPGLASEVQMLHAWKSVLLDAPSASLEPLFPVVPAENRLKWAYSVARQLMRLRSRLVEDEWDFAGVSRQQLESDRDRWRVLAELEAASRTHLRRAGLLDPDDVFTERLDEAVERFAFGRIMVAGVANLSSRQARVLQILAARGIQVEIHLPAPVERLGDFDEWGRPKCNLWEREPLPQDLIAGRLQRSGEPRQLVEKILELAGLYRDQVDALVIGAPDPELALYLVERSRLTDTPIYAPEGKPLNLTGWGRLIHLLGEWRAGGALATLLELLRHPTFRNWARASGQAVEQIEQSLLELQKEHLFTAAAQLSDEATFPSRAIGVVRQFSGTLNALLTREDPESGYAAWLWGVLQDLLAGQELQPESRAVLDQLEDALQELQAEFDPRAMHPADCAELLQFQMESRNHYPERESEERPVSGWLELPWERAPHLVVLGFPDNQVPGPDGTDSFLTPSLCRQLGLYGPDQAAAFHAFRLRLLLQSRRDWGRLDLLLCDRGLDDFPVLPSRFLFLAGGESIPARVRLLLGESPVMESSLPSHFGTVIGLPEPPPVAGISVTDFSAFLANPFHFYLQRVLRWSPPGELPREMDALAFGSLAHAVLEALNRADGALLVAESDIRDFLLEELDTAARGKFGSRPGVAVRIQADSLAERLRAAAPVISAQRQAGWRPFRAEWSFHKEMAYLVDGIPLRGKIDLLEQNQESGAYRIIDYKTADKSAGPMRAHLVATNSRTEDPPFPECQFEEGGKVHRWKDLQLPLYRLVVEQAFGSRPACAYLSLTKAVRDIRLEEWVPGEIQDSAALACAVTIVRMIRAGRFPPGGRSRFEDKWLPWFGGDYAEVLDPQWRARHAEALA